MKDMSDVRKMLCELMGDLRAGKADVDTATAITKTVQVLINSLTVELKYRNVSKRFKKLAFFEVDNISELDVRPRELSTQIAGQTILCECGEKTKNSDGVCDTCKITEDMQDYDTSGQIKQLCCTSCSEVQDPTEFNDGQTICKTCEGR